MNAVYALELFEHKCHSCVVVMEAGGNADEYARLFAPYLINSAPPSGFWLERAVDERLIRQDELKEWRKTAVCLFAAMTNTNEDSV